jgi:hypothetical protein
MTILSKDTHAVLKLQLGEQGTRRITLKRLWNEETNLPCFETLVALIREFQSSWEDSATQKDPFSNVLLSITYTDEDGDSIIISSDEELADAFEQFVTKDPPVVRAFLSDDKKNKSHNPYSNHHIAASTTSSSSHSTSTTNHHHHHNSNLMKLQQLKTPIQVRLPPRLFLRNKDTLWPLFMEDTHVMDVSRLPSLAYVTMQ